MLRYSRRVRRELRDLIELVLVPGLAAILPWRICYPLFQRLSHWKFLYRSESENALREATQRGWVDDPDRWIARRRLTTLLDHADQYLSHVRGDSWGRKYVKAEGAWPEGAAPALLCTFHWGAGMWALHHAALAGMQAHMMVAGPSKAQFSGRAILYRYIVARIASIDRVLKRPTLDASAHLRAALRALRKNEQLMAVVDVPADQFDASEAIAMLGMTARVPRALFRLAVDQQLPVTVFLSGIDWETGGRHIRVTNLGVQDNVEVLVKSVFGLLEDAIAQDSAAWHFWGEAERFFERR
jgi:hypothetical protein